MVLLPWDKVKNLLILTTTDRGNMEIILSTKRKLSFIQGSIPKPIEDHMKLKQWEACNNLVIYWTSLM